MPNRRDDNWKPTIADETQGLGTYGDERDDFVEYTGKNPTLRVARSTQVFILGLFGLLTTLFYICLPLGIILSLMAYVKGSNDLVGIHQGKLIATNESLLRTGKTLAMISLFLVLMVATAGGTALVVQLLLAPTLW